MQVIPLNPHTAWRFPQSADFGPNRAFVTAGDLAKFPPSSLGRSAVVSRSPTARYVVMWVFERELYT